MSVKIKLKRVGKTRQPYYRIVVADARTKRDGRAIEQIGLYRPKEEPSFMEVDAERVAYWLSVGAQPTPAVAAILRVTGDWQKFKGEPAPEPMKVREPKADKQAVFEAAAKEAASEPAADAITPKAKKEKAPKAEAEPATEAPAAEAAPEAAAEAPAEAAPEAAAEAAPETPAEA